MNIKIRSFDCMGCGVKVTGCVREDRKYCSHPCFRKSKRTLKGVNISCEECGKVVYKNPNRFKKGIRKMFCSRQCANANMKRRREKCICIYCGVEFFIPQSALRHKALHCSGSCRDKNTDFLSMRSMNANLSQQRKQGLNKLETKGSLILNSLGISHKTQVPMFDKFVVDVYVEDEMVVVQWDGEYWHTLPKRQKLDKAQDAYLAKCGIKVLRITDRQLNKENIIASTKLIKSFFDSLKRKPHGKP